MKQLRESILDNDFDVDLGFVDVNTYPWVLDNHIWRNNDPLTDPQREILDYNYKVAEYMLKTKFDPLKEEMNSIREQAQLPKEKDSRFGAFYAHQNGVNNLIEDATYAFRRPLNMSQLIEERKEVLDNLGFMDKLLGDRQFVKIFKKSHKSGELSWAMMSWPGLYNSKLSVSAGIYNAHITDSDREYIKKLCKKIGAEYENDADKFLPGGEYADAISKSPNKLEYTPEKLKTLGLVRIEYVR